MSTSIIIVTNNSEPFLAHAIEALEKQTLLPKEVILVDTGSKNPGYLNHNNYSFPLRVIIAEPNSGFCKGNNIGVEHANPDSQYLFFLNPDAFLFPTFLESATKILEQTKNQHLGAITGPAYGYDIKADMPSGLYDTTGIFPTWYGRWYDRGQGMPVLSQLYNKKEEIPAICGALFFCRRSALKTVMLQGREVFDETFYMYKEDIDLSLRLKKKGWSLGFFPELEAHHCRGWSTNRKAIPRHFRLCSAWNELLIHCRQRSPIKSFYSLTKFLTVKLLDF